MLINNLLIANSFKDDRSRIQTQTTPALIDERMYVAKPTSTSDRDSILELVATSHSKPTRSPLIEREIQPIAAVMRSWLYDRTLFTSYERNYCQHKPTPLFSIAGLWCVKVAFTRLTTEKLKFFNFTFLDLEIRHQPSGQPTVWLHNNLANWYQKQNIDVEVAISHQKTLAAAIVLCSTRLEKVADSK